MYPFFSPSQLRGLGILSLFCLFILGIKLSLHWIPQHPLVYWKPLPVAVHSTPTPPPKLPRLDLNLAKASDLAVYPGIGSVLSKRIIAFRESKNGYRSINELQKVYGLSDSTFHSLKSYLYVTPTRHHPKKKINRQSVNLNLATQGELEKKLKISAKQARSILKYRKILGFYSHPRQLQAVYGISSYTYQQIFPFLKVGDLSFYSRKDLNQVQSWTLSRYACMDKILAEAILHARKKQGKFTSWDQVKRIPHLSNRCLSELKAHFFI
ncbi:MAG: helix-hairpin-helix domain-containing protein [Bacteroidota bacterium]